MPAVFSREAEVLRVGALREGFEYSLASAFRQAGPRIVHRKTEYGFALGCLQRSDAHHHAALIGELDCIADQIGEDLLHTVGIGDHVIRQVHAGVEFKRQSARHGLVPRHAHDAAGEVGGVEAPRLQLHRMRLDFREIDHVVEQPPEKLAGFLHRRRDLHLRIARRLVGEIDRQVAQSIERRADLVADDIEKFLLRLHRGARPRFRFFGIAPPLFACSMRARHALDQIGVLEPEPEGFPVSLVDAPGPSRNGREEHRGKNHRRNGERVCAPEQHDDDGQARGKSVIDDCGRVVRAGNGRRHDERGEHQQVEDLMGEARAGQPQDRSRGPGRTADDRDERVAVGPFLGVRHRVRIGAETGAHAVEQQLRNQLDRGDHRRRPDRRRLVEGEPHDGDAAEDRPAA